MVARARISAEWSDLTRVRPPVRIAQETPSIRGTRDLGVIWERTAGHSTVAAISAAARCNCACGSPGFFANCCFNAFRTCQA